MLGADHFDKGYGTFQKGKTLDIQNINLSNFSACAEMDKPDTIANMMSAIEMYAMIANKAAQSKKRQKPALTLQTLEQAIKNDEFEGGELMETQSQDGM